jgi:hypothetical protein
LRQELELLGFGLRAAAGEFFNRSLKYFDELIVLDGQRLVI